MHAKPKKKSSVPIKTKNLYYEWDPLLFDTSGKLILIRNNTLLSIDNNMNTMTASRSLFLLLLLLLLFCVCLHNHQGAFER